VATVVLPAVGVATVAPLARGVAVDVAACGPILLGGLGAGVHAHVTREYGYGDGSVVGGVVPS